MPDRRRKIVYVLGAGFSFGSGHRAPVGRGTLAMPLQNTLLNELCRYHYRRIKELDGIFRTIRRYFSPTTYRATRGHGARRHEDLFGLSVEEIMTFLDEMARGEGDEASALKQAASELQILTVELVSYLSNHGHPGQNQLLKSFAGRLAKTDTLVTFNWDTLLDRVLYNRRGWHPQYGYGITVRKTFRYQTHQPPPVPKKYTRYLKLHGSVNWLARDGDCQITRSFGSDDRNSDVVMMPPKMVKPEIWAGFPIEPTSQGSRSNSAVGRRFYPKLWQEAEDQLEAARRIVVIGYSFPPADFSVANMLRRAIGGAKAATGVNPEVDIVDPNAPELAERFYRSFKIRVPMENQYLSLRSYLAGERAI